MGMDDWAGESARTTDAEYVPENIVILPVGIEKDGTRHREVHIERMTGIDDHNLASSDARKNGAIGTTKVICRCVQEVPGLDRDFSDRSTVTTGVLFDAYQLVVIRDKISEARL